MLAFGIFLTFYGVIKNAMGMVCVRIMTAREINIPNEWKAAAEEIAGRGGPVLVIGAPDSGKTTFLLYLTRYLCSLSRQVAWIEGDPGQPFIGPPAALSLALYSEPGDVLKNRPPLAMSFVGNTSPVGHLLEMLSGLRRLVDRARLYNPDFILINTCGLVAGGAARELKFHEIDMLEPRYIIALQRGNEVEHLLSPHAFRSGLLIHRLPVPSAVKVTTREARLAAREQRFKEYFRKAGFQDIAISDVGVHGPGLKTGERLGFRDINRLSKIVQGIVVYAEHAADRLFLIVEGDYAEEELYTARQDYNVREIVVIKTSELDHLLIGLGNDQNLCLGLGIIRGFDIREQILRVITPLKDITPVRTISFGSLRVSPAGIEIGRW